MEPHPPLAATDPGRLPGSPGADPGPPAGDLGFLDPELARRTAVGHHVFTGIATLLMIPAALLIFLLGLLLSRELPMPGAPEEWAALLTASAGSLSGGLAWCALCLLFFKRSDPRWQLAAWSLCLLHGLLTLPGIAGWTFFWLREMTRNPHRADAGMLLYLLLFLAILANSLACIRFGFHYARLARRSIARHRAG